MAKTQSSGLMGLVLSVHKGEKKLSEVRPGMKKKVERIMREMGPEQLATFDPANRLKPQHFTTGQHVKVRGTKYS